MITMMNERVQWLPHLRDSIPVEAYGYSVSMYSIALEGWRRGLTLKFTNNNRSKSVIRYSLSDGMKEHHFMGAQGDLITKEAISICKDKYLTKKYLSEAGVSIPEGEYFSQNISDPEIISFADKLGYPVVVKPTNAAGGRGVIANIKNQEEFKKALHYVRHELNYKDLIVEKYFSGEDYRVLVIGDKVVGAIHRIPANVIGDGKSTIKKLLDSKIKEKKQNPALTGSPIKIDKEMHSILQQQGYTLDSIPEKGERIFLKTKSNISAGGDPIDVTDMLTDEIKQNAVNALKAIPGLVQGGVDVLYNKESQKSVILEINTIPSIRTHLFPVEGKARDVPKAIIDYYFPETVSNHNKPLYYFDIAPVFETFSNRTIKEVVIPDMPQGDLCSRQLKVYGIERVNRYMRHVHKYAKSLKLNGFIKNLSKSSVLIVISGPRDVVETFINNVKNNKIKFVKAKKVTQDDWEKPVKIGFQVIKSETASKPAKKESNGVSLKEYNKVVEERDFYKQEYINMRESKSWKLTQPIRSFKKYFRKNNKDR